MKKIWIGVLVLLFLGNFPAKAQRYVVLMTESFEQPLAKSANQNSIRARKAADNQAKRVLKSEKLRGFARGKGIEIRGGKAFVDGAVGFVADLSREQVNQLMQDQQVQAVFEDFTIQGTRPRMQGTRPRMQGESVLMDDLYDPVSKASCAVPILGGSKNGRANSSIWILDTGVDATHVDLNVNTNPALSRSFVDSEMSPFEDFVGHGTHCAGLAAGKGVGNPGVTGMSRGAEVISVKVLDRQGLGSWSQLILALDHVSQFSVNGDVVLMSLGSGLVNDCSNSEPILKSMIEQLAKDKVTVVMSAGNESIASSQNLPGCINGSGILTIGALDFDCSGPGSLAGYSNFGTPSIDFVAPGTQIFSTFPDNQYQVMSGTSMAAALVAGLVHSDGGSLRGRRQIQSGGFTYSLAGR
jgi:subtilisin family serine protease